MTRLLDRLALWRAWARRTFLQPASVHILHIPGDVARKATEKASTHTPADRL